MKQKNTKKSKSVKKGGQKTKMVISNPTDFKVVKSLTTKPSVLPALPKFDKLNEHYTSKEKKLRFFK